MSFGAQPVATGGAGGLHTLLRWPLDRHGGLEPKDLAQAGWLETVNGKVAATSAATCARGAGAVLDYFVLSEAMAHLVQQVEVVNSPTTPLSPVSLTLTSTWGHRELARRRPKPSSTEVPVGPQRQEEHFEWTWAAENFPVDWELACAQQKLLGAGSTISAGPNAVLFWGGANGWSSSTFLSARPRATTRGDAAAKRQFGAPFVAWWRRWLAPWPLGGRGEHCRARYNSQSTRLLQSPYPILALGIQAGIFRHKKLAHTLREAATCGDWAGLVTRVMVFIKSHTTTAAVDSALLEAMGAGSLPGRQEQRKASPRLASASAAAKGWPSCSSWSSKWGRGCRSGWIRAEPAPSRWPTKRMWETPCQVLHSKKSTMCARHTSTQLFLVTTASSQGNFAAASRTASTFHRPAHGVRGEASQTVELVSCVGLEAQAIRRSPHNWPHRGAVAGAVAVSKATGAKWENDHDAAYFWSYQGVRPCSLGTLDHGGGSEGVEAVGGFLVIGPGKIRRARRALGRKSEHQFSNATFGLLVRFRRRPALSRGRQMPHFLSGLLGPFFQVAVGPQRLPNSCSQLSRLPTHRLWNVVDDISGHVAGTPKMVEVLTAEAARLLVEGLQARHLPLSKGKSKVLIDGPDKLKHAFLQQLEVFGIDECDTARNVGADLQLGRRRRALVVKGRCKENEVRQAAAQGRGTHSQPNSHWLECRGALGFPGSGFLSDTAPNHQNRRGQRQKLAQPKTKRRHNNVGQRPGSGGKNHRSDKSLCFGRREFGKAFQTSTPCRLRCAAPWPGSVISRGRGVALRTQRVLTLSRLGWSAQSAKHLTSHNGTKIDLQAVSPKTVGVWVDQASLLWSDSSAHWNQSKGPLFWESIRPLLVSVADDDVGNLKAAACGAVPSDVLQGQSVLDGEDHAAAMVGHITLDPVTLHINCEGTIAIINGPKHKVLGAHVPRAHVWNRLLVSHDEVRAVKGHATEQSATRSRGELPTCARREKILQTLSQRKGQTYTNPLFVLPRQSLRVLPWPSKRHGRTCCSGPEVGTTHQGCCAKITGTAAASETQAQAAQQGGAESWQRHHLLRQMWGGLLGACGRAMPQLRRNPRGQSITAAQIVCAVSKQALPGWTVEHVRRRSLDEATTLVAQLESCEAGLGRMVMGPTTPKKQRAAPQAAVLAHWQSVGEAVDNEDLALQLFDQGRLSLWEACGLNDQLVSKLTLKAGGVRSLKTD